jgi:putative hydrolase of the HAD superfamily
MTPDPLSPSSPVMPVGDWSDAGRPMSVPIVDRLGRSRRVRGLVIDLDDTLYPRRRFLQSGYGAVSAYLASTLGVDADRAYSVLLDCLERGDDRRAFQVVCRACGLDEETVPVLVEVFRAHQPKIFLGRGARDMLGTLRAAGWKLAVLTNGLPAVQARKVQALRLGELVDHVIYAEHFAPGGKPDTRAFQAAVQRLGTRPSQTVCLGDDPGADVAGGRRLGLATIRLAVPGVQVDPAEDADVIVHALDEVPRVAAALLEGVLRHAA